MTQAKHLRRFTFDLYHDDAPHSELLASLSFTFSVKQGLELAVQGASMESKKILQEYVAQIERSRKTLGLHGEAIVLALLTKPEIFASTLEQDVLHDFA